MSAQNKKFDAAMFYPPSTKRNLLQNKNEKIRYKSLIAYSAMDAVYSNPRYHYSTYSMYTV
jgi:hypothetical protein